VDINLNTLKRDIEEYLERAGVAIFRGASGGMEGLDMILWDVEQYPDYQMFLDTARKAGAGMVIFATREFEAEDVEEAMEQLEECEIDRDERRELQSRLRELRAYEGVTCSLELAFDHQNRMYVYEIRPDWYDEFLGIEEEILAHLPAEEDISGDSLGGYFSRN
jgi:hypothetical protein